MFPSTILWTIIRLVFGTLYPAYASYKAVKTKNVKEYVKWMMYWIVFALFTSVETVADIFVSWIPFYYEMKILFVLWLLSPATKGASILYRKFVHPQLSKREQEIDTYIAKASDQGYSAILTLGSKGLNYATNVVLTTAIKGQSKIADHLKKSYSMSDIDNTDGREKFVREEEEILEDEDDLDNRMIEESYQREMMEKEEESLLQQKVKAPPRRRSVKSKDTSDLGEIPETDEDAITTRSGKRKSYSHKEAYHYGTLPKTKGRTSRPSVKNANFEQP